MKSTILLIIIPTVVCAALMGAYLLAARTILEPFFGPDAGKDTLALACRDTIHASTLALSRCGINISPTLISYAAFEMT